jgi:hypothetical protein
VNYPNIVLVKLHLETLLISTYTTQPSLIAAVKLHYNVTSYEPILTAKSLILFTYVKETGRSELLEYSLQNLAQPQFLKNL